MTEEEKRKQSPYAVDGDTLYDRLRSDRPTYAGTYDKQLSDLYSKITTRQPFQYDVTKDPLYQQYKGQYIQQGKLAMRDTMGQAAGLTGGYGSSYGQQVGQQAYDAYLQKLGDVVPELYSAAYGRYNDEGDRLMQQYAMVGAQREVEYNRYRNDLADWENERAYQTQLENQEYNRRMAEEQQAYQRARDEENTAYQREQQEYANRMNEEQIAYQRAQSERNSATSIQQTNYSNLYKMIGSTGYNPTDEELAAAGMTRAAADALRQEYLRANGLLPVEQPAYYGGGGVPATGDAGSGNPQALSAADMDRITRNLRVLHTGDERSAYLDSLGLDPDMLPQEQLNQLIEAKNNPYNPDSGKKSTGSGSGTRGSKKFVARMG